MPIPLNVRHIRQVEGHFCGAAVAQMILDFRGVPRPASASNDADWQRQIWNDVKAKTTGPPAPQPAHAAESYLPDFAKQQCVHCTSGDWNCWATTPQALEAVLNARLINPAHKVALVRGDVGAMEHAVAALLRSVDLGAPPAALVGGGYHWVVIRGYKANKPTPTPVPILAQNLNGVYVRDSNLRATRRLISAEAFLQDVLPTSCGVTADQDRYVVLVDRSLRQEFMMAPRPPRAEADRFVPLLGPAGAIAHAERHVQDLLAEDEDKPVWQEALGGVKAGRPQLVQRLDRKDDYYYIVPFQRGEVLTARVAIDAKTGGLREIGGVEDEPALPPWKAPEAFLKERMGTLQELAAVTRVLRPEGVGIHPVLVWRPCEQSQSPLSPFSLLTVGDRVLYFRVDDGEAFPSLTSRGSGR